MRRLFAIVLALAGLLLYLILGARGGLNQVVSVYWFALVIAILAAGILLVMVGLQLWTLYQRLRVKVFGSTLTLKLIGVFALIAIVPCAVLYAVSTQFLSKSIDIWFDVKVDNALNRSLNLGQTVFTQLQNDLQQKVEFASLRLMETPDAEIPALLDDLRAQLRVQSAVILEENGRVIAISVDNPQQARLLAPTEKMLAEAHNQGSYHAIETLGETGADVQVRALTAVVSYSLADARYLQFIQPVPKQLAADAALVEKVRSEYKQLALGQKGLKNYFNVMLAMTSLIVTLAALAVGFYLSNRISAPLSLLVEATRAVAQGDLSPRHLQVKHQHDELGFLTLSFYRMVRQLAETRLALELNQQQTEAARAYLESLLANLSSGVLAFDAECKLRSFNPVASEILGYPCSKLSDFALPAWGEVFSVLSPLAALLYTRLSATEQAWQLQVEYAHPAGNRILFLHGAVFSEVSQRYVIVIDDISQLVHAQRSAAWGEVAKRLAHEIRNPLTPIQLSAERLQHKLSKKLEASDADILTRGTQTIVTQVDALKRMVDAFKDYARNASVVLQPLDLNALLQEVLNLYEGDKRLQARLTPLPLPLLADTTGLRQVLHNLIKNAQEAVETVVQGKIILYTEKQQNCAIFKIEDNGVGFPVGLLAEVFEPYVTTKPKGTGLGLAIIKKIIEEHHGQVRAYHCETGGAGIEICLPLLHSPIQGEGSG